MNKESKLYVVLFTAISTFIFVFVLALLNSATAPQVQKNLKLMAVKSVLNAFGIEYKTDDEALERFENEITVEERQGLKLYKATVNGKEIYAVIFTGSGLWGPITGVLAVDKDVSNILGLDFISQNETPGLGGRIEESWFKEQFRAEKIVDGKVQIVLGTPKDDKEDGKVDGITGATLTSKSVEKIVNDNLETLRKLIRGE